MAERPSIILIAGPNGAGKTSAAPYLLRDALEVKEYVNSHLIAKGLSPFQPESAAMHAGRIMLDRLFYLADQRVNFGFETTLAGRRLAPWIGSLRFRNYSLQLIFLWLPSPEMAIARVEGRVRMGGYDVSPETIRRQYHTGLKSFFEFYRGLADAWKFYDSSGPSGPRLLATGAKGQENVIYDAGTWNMILEQVNHA
jgi:predicted ABC-type ATPase